MNDIQTYFKEFETKYSVEVPEDLKKFYSITSSLHGDSFTFKILHDKLANCYFYPSIAAWYFSEYYNPEIPTEELLIKLINDYYKVDYSTLYLMVGIDLILKKYFALKFENGEEAGYFLIGKETNENPIFLFDKLNNNYEVDNEYSFEKNAATTMALRKQNHPLTHNMGDSFLVFPKKMESPVKRYSDILNENEYYMIYAPLIKEREYSIILESLNYLLERKILFTELKYDASNNNFLLSYKKSGTESVELFSFIKNNENLVENIYASINQLLKTFNLNDKNIILILDNLFDPGQLAVSYIDNVMVNKLREEKTCHIWDVEHNQYK